MDAVSNVAAIKPIARFINNCLSNLFSFAVTHEEFHDLTSPLIALEQGTETPKTPWFDRPRPRETTHQKNLQFSPRCAFSRFKLNSRMKTVAVIGASNDRSRYGNMAVRAF